jgi:hypothetical protein
MNLVGNYVVAIVENSIHVAEGEPNRMISSGRVEDSFNGHRKRENA